MKDTLVKATAGGCRLYAATTTNLVNEAIRRHGLYPVAAAALGRTMTGALLLAANLKNQEALTLKIQGDGPLGTVVADASPDGFARGYVDQPKAFLPLNAQGKLDVGGGVGKGFLTVTRFLGFGKPVTGTSALVTGEIGDDLTEYLYSSEQTPSSVGLGVLVRPDFVAEAAGGFWLQPFPDATEEQIARMEENVHHLRPVSSLIAEGMHAEDLAREVLQGLGEVSVLAETELAFRCHCSKRRLERVLLSLGKQDLESLISDGKAEVVCHFCGEKYHFTKEELEAIYAVAMRQNASHAK